MKVLVYGVLLALLLLAACTPTGQVTTNETTKIGVIAPLTGPLAEYGVAHVNGVMLALEDAGVAAHDVEIIIEDSEYDPKKAISAFNKLVDVDDVDIVMDWGAPTSEAIAPIAEARQIPFIAFSYDVAVSKDRSYVLRTWNRPEAFATTLSDYFGENKSYGILKTELLYLDAMHEGMVIAAGEDKVDVLDTFTFGDVDFRSSLLKLESSDVDIVGVFLASGQIAQWYSQKEELGFVFATFGTDFFESQQEIDNAQGTMDGAVYANMVVSDAFKDKYVTAYDSVSQITFAGSAYDMTTLVVDVLEENRPEDTLTAIRQTTNFTGVLGDYAYREVDGDKHLTQPIVIKQIIDGQVVVI